MVVDEIGHSSVVMTEKYAKFNLKKLRDDFKSSSPAILLGISYKFMPDFKIFAEYSTATVKREWEYYDNDDDDYKKIYTGSGSFSLGITYDFEMSPEEKAAKMEEREAKQKTKREKLKKELENF